MVTSLRYFCEENSISGNAYAHHNKQVLSCVYMYHIVSWILVSTDELMLLAYPDGMDFSSRRLFTW